MGTTERVLKWVLILLLAMVWFFAIVSLAIGSELVYTPVNPSFGGSPFNAVGLLQLAQAQNKLKEPREEWKMPERDPIEEFTECLNRQVLYNLSRKIVDGAFGEEGVTEGTYDMDDYRINVSMGLDGITVRLTDAATGNETVIQVPHY